MVEILNIFCFHLNLQIIPLLNQYKTVRQILSNYPSRHVNSHLFLDALNTHWVENGLLDAGIRAILLNQKPSGINAGHYIKAYTQNDKSGKERLKV